MVAGVNSQLPGSGRTHDGTDEIKVRGVAMWQVSGVVDCHCVMPAELATHVT